MNLLNQTQLYGLDYYFNEITSLYNKNRLPNKIILSGFGVGLSHNALILQK